MAEESYRIVFRGELVAGVSRAEAEANLKSRFKYSDSALAKLFTGKGVVLKSGMDQSTAEKYEKALAGVGLVCEVQSTEAIEVAEPERPTPVVDVEPVSVAPVAQEEPFSEPEPPTEAVAETSDAVAEPVPTAFEYPPAQEVVEAPAVTRQPEAWYASENVFETEAVESAPVREDAADEFTAPEQAAAWDESEDVFETEAVESVPVQEEEAEEFVAPEQAATWDEAEDVFATEAVESAPVREEAAEEFAAPPQAEASDRPDDNFEPEPAPAAPAPEASFFEEFPAAASPVSATILDTLKQTRPWVRFISILLFICSALGVLAFVVILLSGMLGGLSSVADTPTMLMFMFQMLSLLLYLIPAYYLFKYSAAIGTLLKGGGEAELEAALGYQKSFWRFSGILTLICLVLGALGILAAVLIPIMMG